MCVRAHMHVCAYMCVCVHVCVCARMCWRGEKIMQVKHYILQSLPNYQCRVFCLNCVTTVMVFKNCEADGLSRRHHGILG